MGTFIYDGAGRRTGQIFGGAPTQFSYDAAGRLVGVDRTGYQATLGHDPEGLRYRRAETGQSEALFFGEWVERRGGETVRLTHGPGVDNVVAEVTLAGDVRTLLRNGTANVTHVAVAGILEPAPRRYEAFGGVRSGSSAVERGFAGRPPEGATGLINLRARHYDPSTGTFLQVDPLGIEAVQTYAYARQNPYRFWDPSGRDPGQLIFGVDSSIHASNFAPDPSRGATIGPQEPAASLFGLFDLYSTSPVSDLLFPNRGPLHYFAAGHEDYLVRGLSGQWEPGEEFLAVVPGGPVVRGGIGAAPRSLTQGVGKLADHHLFPRQFEKFFRSRGIDIDKHTVTVDQATTHLKAIHGSGNLGQKPGKWNQQWQEFIDANPNASAKDVYQQLGQMMDDFGLSDLLIHPYRK